MKGILSDVKNFSKCGTSREKIWFKLDSSPMQLTSEQLPVGLIDQFTCQLSTALESQVDGFDFSSGLESFRLFVELLKMLDLYVDLLDS